MISVFILFIYSHNFSFSRCSIKSSWVSPSLRSKTQWMDVVKVQRLGVAGIGLNSESRLDHLPLFCFFSELKAAAAFQLNATRFSHWMISGISQTGCGFLYIRPFSVLSCSSSFFDVVSWPHLHYVECWGALARTTMFLNSKCLLAMKCALFCRCKSTHTLISFTWGDVWFHMWAPQMC